MKIRRGPAFTGNIKYTEYFRDVIIHTDSKKLGAVFETVLNTKNAKCVKKNPQTQCRWTAVFSLRTVTDECRCAQRPVIKGKPPQKREKKAMFVASEIVSVQPGSFVPIKTSATISLFWWEQICSSALHSWISKRFRAHLTHGIVPNACSYFNMRASRILKEEHGGTRAGGFTLRMCKENEKLGDIILQKSREQGGISGWRSGIKRLCLHSRQKWLVGELILKRGLEDHAAIVQSLGAPN